MEPENERRGFRCPVCYWALYDGDWCQGPDWCPNRGLSVEEPARLTNKQAMERIRYQCKKCGRRIPCRHCKDADLENK